MSFTTAANTAGREPVTVLELDMSTCSLAYGNSPCTATGAPGSECYNTFGTCQDQANFATQTTTYRFISDQDVPVDSDALPCLTSVSYAPTEIEPGGMGKRASVTVRLRDFTHTDTASHDPYRANRAIASSGTFWTRFLARHRYYVGRTMRVREGYVVEPWSFDDFLSREYIIESISLDNDSITIVGKDVLKLADDDRAQAPLPSAITLDSGITAGSTSITFTGDDIGTLSNGAYVAIGDEILTLGTGGAVTSTVTYTGCTRASWGTTAAEADSGDKAQLCLSATDENVRDTLETLLVTYAGVPSGYIDTAGWDAEETASLASYALTYVIHKPTGVKTLVDELLEQCTLSMWWDDTSQKVRLKAETPFSSVVSGINEAEAIVHGSARYSEAADKQVTRVEIYYDLRDYSEDDDKPQNYKLSHIEIDTNVEGADQYGRSKVRKIFSRWFDETNASAASLLAQRTLSRFKHPLPEIRWRMDASKVETYNVGDVTDIRSRVRVNPDGTNYLLRSQITKVNPVVVGHEYEYTAISYFPSEDAAVSNQTISASTNDYDLYTALGGPPFPVEITVTINASVVVGSTNTATAGFTTGNLHPDSVITLINNGTITGHGGAGGTGTFGATSIPTAGGLGLNATCDLVVTNNGTIQGGGGGGGYGGDNDAASYYGGGGGAGETVGAAGAGDVNGTAGTLAAGGAAGAPTDEGYAGDGGNPGQDGGDGLLYEYDFSLPGAITITIPGASGGNAIDSNGNTITWVSTGTILGAIT